MYDVRGGGEEIRKLVKNWAEMRQKTIQRSLVELKVRWRGKVSKFFFG